MPQQRLAQGNLDLTARVFCLRREHGDNYPELETTSEANKGAVGVECTRDEETRA